MNNGFHSLGFPFSVSPSAGKFAEEQDYDTYIRNLIRQTLLTANGERVHRPSFGAGLRRLVFAPNSPGIASLTQTLILQALNNWMSNLIRVENIEVLSNEEILEVRVSYTVLESNEQQFLDLEVPV